MVSIKAPKKSLGAWILLSLVFGCTSDKAYINFKSEFLLQSSLAQIESSLKRSVTSKTEQVKLLLEKLTTLDRSLDSLYENMVTNNGGWSEDSIESTFGAIVTPDSALFIETDMLLTQVNITNLNLDFALEPHPLIVWKAKILNLQKRIRSAVIPTLRGELNALQASTRHKDFSLFRSFFLSRTASLNTSTDSINVRLEHQYILWPKKQGNQVYVNPPGKSYPLEDGMVEFEFELEIPSHSKIDAEVITATMSLKLPWADTLFTTQFEYLIQYK